jgi:hypothetical protein
MARIALEAAFATKFLNIKQTVELCDASGRVLGKFVPLIDQSEWEPLTPEASEDELDRRAKSSEKRHTIAQVLAHLEKL